MRSQAHAWPWHTFRTMTALAAIWELTITLTNSVPLGASALHTWITHLDFVCVWNFSIVKLKPIQFVTQNAGYYRAGVRYAVPKTTHVTGSAAASTWPCPPLIAVLSPAVSCALHVPVFPPHPACMPRYPYACSRLLRRTIQLVVYDSIDAQHKAAHTV
eukprot:jgi/Ulvmu1/12712/UM095_0016.1